MKSATPILATQTTGNLWFALPRVAPPPGGVDRLAFLTMRDRGLIELSARKRTDPFLSAGLKIDGRDACTTTESVMLDDWIPRFTGGADGVTFTMTWLCCTQRRGLVLRVSVENGSSKPVDAEMSFTLRWAKTAITTYEADPIDGRISLDPNGWGGGIALGWVTARTDFALGIGTGDEGAMSLRVIAADGSVNELDPRSGPVRRFQPGAQVELVCTKSVQLAAGEKTHYDLFLSAAPDTKAAPLHARYLRDLGFDALLSESRHHLAQLNSNLPAALAQDEYLGPLARRNRLFCYYYSQGRTLDSEELCPVTSRSSDYYVSAAYWDRDTLLWSFPTILDMDAAAAREVLQVAFGRQGRNIGQHSRFIDGTVCEPGFELDELCAPMIALDAYLRTTGDWSLIDSPVFTERFEQIEYELLQRKHPTVALFSTEYLPTDDLAVYPYCTYNNVLVWVLCGAMRRVADYRKDVAAVARWTILREHVHDAIWANCVALDNGEKLFAWSTDVQGKFRLYDEPPGSLTLLPWYGFCSYDDPIYKATVGWIYSTRNPHYFPQADEIGCLHEPHPWVLAVANSLLIPQRRDAALALLSRSNMDHGLACEAIHEATGEVISGRHFATCAGFLCHALVTSFRRTDHDRPSTFSTTVANPVAL